MRNFGEQLKAGPMIGLSIHYPSPGSVERIGPDWDWIWIDGQHGSLDYRDIMALVRAADFVGKPSVVRVPGHDPGTIGKMLDTACSGLMVPLVDTPQQAKSIVQAAKFAPLGSRSFGGRRPIDLYGRSYAHANLPQPLLICQIETLDSVNNVDAIAAVEGVDALFFGPDDVGLRGQLPMDKPWPDGYMDQYLKAVTDAAAKHGKLAGSVFTTPQAVKKALQLGYTLILGGSDVGFLATASAEKSKLLRPS